MPKQQTRLQGLLVRRRRERSDVCVEVQCMEKNKLFFVLLIRFISLPVR